MLRYSLVYLFIFVKTAVPCQLFTLMEPLDCRLPFLLLFCNAKPSVRAEISRFYEQRDSPTSRNCCASYVRLRSLGLAVLASDSSGELLLENDIRCQQQRAKIVHRFSFKRAQRDDKK